MSARRLISAEGRNGAPRFFGITQSGKMMRKIEIRKHRVLVETLCFFVFAGRGLIGRKSAAGISAIGEPFVLPISVRSLMRNEGFRETAPCPC